MEGDPAYPPPPDSRKWGRNAQEWEHIFNRDIISMPDKWEYPRVRRGEAGAFHLLKVAYLHTFFPFLPLLPPSPPPPPKKNKIHIHISPTPLQYASWDLAFHMIPFAKVDPEFAKSQLVLFLREQYMSPNGQIPGICGERGRVGVGLGD